MMGAGRISNMVGMLRDDELERQRALLESYGLPLSYSGMDVAAVTDTMQSDKKVRDGAINWVLMDGLGNAVSLAEGEPGDRAECAQGAGCVETG